MSTVAPTVTATVTPSPVVAGGYINSNATVTLVASDAQSGVKSIEYQIGARDFSLTADAYLFKQYHYSNMRYNPKFVGYIGDWTV